MQIINTRHLKNIACHFDQMEKFILLVRFLSRFAPRSEIIEFSRSFKIVLTIILLPVIILAQGQELQFPASSLYNVTTKLIGDSTCWPIIISQAQHNVSTNSFKLNSQAQAQIKKFAAIHKSVNKAKLDLSQQVKAGAKVFASAELDSATKLLKIYDSEVSNGNITNAQQIGEKFINQVNITSKLTLERRTEEVNAKLAKKTGIVDKRKGLLGLWQTAYIGDLFSAYDGVRTGNESYALLFFTDGVDVTVDPNTIVVIRESKMDKLDNTIKRDIALVNGSILTKLTPKAKEINTFAFKAGTSESNVQSTKFWASTIQDKKAKLSNYDGTIDVKASNTKITLQQNQGTVVEKDKPPLPPVNLLEAPQLKWIRLDTVIYTDNLNLQWTKVNNSVSYTIEVSPSKNFDQNIKRISAKEPYMLLTGIPVGSVYVRVYAIDKYGLRGIDSPTYQIIRVKETQPPPIQIDGWDIDRKYTINNEINIKGKTRANASITINEKKITVNNDGSFSFNVPIIETETLVKIIATDNYGSSTRTLSIVSMDLNKIFDIIWNHKSDETTIYAQSEFIEAHGIAYPDVKVTATLGEQVINIQTNSKGEWAISLKAIKGENLTLTFYSINDKKIIGTKSWRVE